MNMQATARLPILARFGRDKANVETASADRRLELAMKPTLACAASSGAMNTSPVITAAQNSKAAGRFRQIPKKANSITPNSLAATQRQLSRYGGRFSRIRRSLSGQPVFQSCDRSFSPPNFGREEETARFIPFPTPVDGWLKLGSVGAKPSPNRARFHFAFRERTEAWLCCRLRGRAGALLGRRRCNVEHHVARCNR